MNLLLVKDGRTLYGFDSLPLDKHAGHSTELFFKKFWVSLVLTVLVLLYGDIVKTILLIRVAVVFLFQAGMIIHKHTRNICLIN